MLLYKTKKRGDTITQEPNIHWQLVKDATDVKFDDLPNDEKDRYVHSAWHTYALKNGNVRV
jgi:hypothetical protein